MLPATRPLWLAGFVLDRAGGASIRVGGATDLGLEVAVDLLHLVGGEPGRGGVFAEALRGGSGVDAVGGEAVACAYYVGVFPFDVGELLFARATGGLGGCLELVVADVPEGSLNEVARHDTYATTLVLERSELSMSS